MTTFFLSENEALVFVLHISTQEISKEGNSLLFIYYLQNSNSKL